MAATPDDVMEAGVRKGVRRGKIDYVHLLAIEIENNMGTKIGVPKTEVPLNHPFLLFFFQYKGASYWVH